MQNHTYKHTTTFELEEGGQLDNLEIHYTTYGQLNACKNNVVWVFHALTANSQAGEWWDGLFGAKQLFSPDEYFIICVNTIGSPYGSTAPNSIFGDEIYGLDFPFFTVRDVVNTQLLIAQKLGITKIHLAIGGSFGGYQAIEFAYAFGGEIDNLILIATAAQESPWNIALHEAQRMALLSDATFAHKTKRAGQEALAACRAMAMLAYRTFDAFTATQTNETPQTDNHKAVSYVQYQGEKFVKRFQAHCYYYLLKCLDTHHIGRGRGGLKKALRTIKTNTLVIGIDSDILIPTSQQKELAAYLPNSEYHEISSLYGHDGFLIETKQIAHKIKPFLTKKIAQTA